MFKPNYPYYDAETYAMLSTPMRVGVDPAYTGQGVGIAFIDSGFFPHPDLGDRVLCHADATTSRIVEGRRFREPEGYAWHGQMTSVIAAGDGRTSGGLYRGIASQAHLVLIKVSTRKFQIKEPDILRGMNWLIANHHRFNVRILNISVGGDDVSNDPDHPLYQAARTLTEQGVIIVVAAGNSGMPNLVPPASAPDVLTIGGFDDQNSLDPALWRPYFNNYSHSYDGTSKPEIVAPSSWIVSPIMPGTSEAREAFWLAQLLHTNDKAEINRLIWEGQHNLAVLPEAAKQPDQAVYDFIQARINKNKIIDAYHQHVDGTSVAAPIVASVIAQLLEINPRLTPAEIRALLIASAQPLPDRDPQTQGAGRIDPRKAVAILTQSNPPAN